MCPPTLKLHYVNVQIQSKFLVGSFLSSTTSVVLATVFFKACNDSGPNKGLTLPAVLVGPALSL